MVHQQTKLDTRQVILGKASDLFYRQGYQATGINQIIEESGVAKATFYSHFPSKEELCLAYLEQAHLNEISTLRREIANRKSPLKRYLAPMELLRPWLIETDFKGCPFLNVAPEIVDHQHPIRKVGQRFYQEVQKIVAGVVEELVAIDPKRYSHLNPNQVAKDYVVVFAGTVSLCGIFHASDPLDRGIALVRELLQ